MKNTQKGFIGIGAIIAIVAVIAIAGTATYVVKNKDNAKKANKDYATDPYVEDSKIMVNGETIGNTNVVNSNANATVTGTVQTPVGTVNVSGNAGQMNTINAIDSVAVYPVTSLFKNLKGEKMPFEISYRDIWQVRVHNVSNPADHGPSGEFTQLTSSNVAYAGGSSPSINILASKAGEKSFPFASAKEYCRAGTNSGLGLEAKQKSLTINGYDACYTYINGDNSLIDHQYLVYHNGYFVQISFREKYTTGSFTGPTTTKTEYDNSYYLPEFKTVAYSVKFTN